MTRLMVADVDQIQGYVFASSRLREMAGASRLVEVWSRDGARDVLSRFGDGNWERGVEPDDRPVGGGRSWEVLMSAAGMLLVRLQDSVDPNGVAAALQLEFARRVPGASLTTAWIEDTPDLAASTWQLNRELRRRKDASERTSMPGLPLTALRCSSCAEQAAVRRENDDNICAICDAKRRERASGQHGALRAWRQQTESGLDLNGGPFEFDRIADARGYIGVIVADGDGIGELWEQFTEPSQVRGFSAALSSAVQDALFDALDAVRPATKDNVLAVEIAMFGGDDVTLVCPGDRAIELAEALCRTFEQASAASIAGLGLARERLTMSAGVAVVKASHPFQVARQAAYECLQRAKAGRRMSGDTPERGYLDFAVLSAEHPSSRQRALAERRIAGAPWGEVVELHLTARPYPIGDGAPAVSTAPISDAASLVTVARSLAAASSRQRGKLHDLDAALKRCGDDEDDLSRAFARVRDAYAQIVARMREVEPRDDAPGSVIARAVGSPDSPWHGPYPITGIAGIAQYHRTPVADAIELSRCIGGGSN